MMIMMIMMMTVLMIQLCEDDGVSYDDDSIRMVAMKMIILVYVIAAKAQFMQ